MNTFQDLNFAANTAVTYANAAAYAISFGANAGNTTANISNSTGTVVYPKRVTVNSISNAYTDLLIQIQANSSSLIKNISYVGPWSNISTIKNNSLTWTVSGIRDVARYDEAFANLVISVDPTQNLSAVNCSTTITDQVGNTRTYSVVVNPPTWFTVQNFDYHEDQLANLAGIQITDTTANVFTVRFNAGDGEIYYAGNLSTTLDLTNTRANLNSLFSANAIQFLPPADSTSTHVVRYYQTRDSDGVQQALAVPLIGTNVSSHDEYIEPFVLGYTPIANSVISGFEITDQRGSPATVLYDVTLTVLDSTVGNLAIGSGARSSTITFDDLTRTAINANLTGNQIIFVPNTNATGNTSIRYIQTNVTDGIVQANVDVDIYNVYSNTTAAAGANVKIPTTSWSVVDTGDIANAPISVNYVFNTPTLLISDGNTLTYSQYIDGTVWDPVDSPGYTLSNVTTTNAVTKYNSYSFQINNEDTGAGFGIQGNNFISITQTSLYRDDLRNGFTLEGWYRLSNFDYANLWHYVPLALSSGANNVGYYLINNPGAVAPANPELTFDAPGAPIFRRVVIDMANYVDRWFHLAISSSGPASGNLANIYIDGNYVANVSHLANVNHSLDLLIGGRHQGNANVTLYVDQVRLSNIARYSGSSFGLPTGAWTSDANTKFLITAGAGNTLTLTPPPARNTNRVLLWPDALPGDANGNITLGDLGSNPNVTITRNSSYNYTVGNIYTQSDWLAANLYIDFPAGINGVGNGDASNGEGRGYWTYSISSNGTPELNLTGSGNLGLY